MNCIDGVLILAGGKSERMLFPKAYLEIKGKTFLKKIVDEYYSAGIKNIYIVLNGNYCTERWKKYIDQVKSTATIIINNNPEFGRLHSLKLGFKKILNDSEEKSQTRIEGLHKALEYCFIQNVDNPFVNRGVIISLMKSRNPFGYTSPTYIGSNGHPILISKKIIEHLHNLPEGDFNLRKILLRFSKREVEIDNGDILININTAEEYNRYLAHSNLLKKDEIHSLKQLDCDADSIPLPFRRSG